MAETRAESQRPVRQHEVYQSLYRVSEKERIWNNNKNVIKEMIKIFPNMMEPLIQIQEVQEA